MKMRQTVNPVSVLAIPGRTKKIETGAFYSNGSLVFPKAETPVPQLPGFGLARFHEQTRVCTARMLLPGNRNWESKMAAASRFQQRNNGVCVAGNSDSAGSLSGGCYVFICSGVIVLQVELVYTVISLSVQQRGEHL